MCQTTKMFSRAMLAAFTQEIIKLAAPIVTNIEEVRDTLEPGDILYTRPKNINKLHHKLFYELESRVQGSPYTHVGLYAGDGKVIDAGAWDNKNTSSMAIHKIPLRKFMNRYNFKILRVNAPKPIKTEAINFAKNQIGKPFNLSGMLGLVLPLKKDATKEDRIQQAEARSFFCSELVANAYANIGLAKTKKLKHIMPGDIAKSKLTRVIAEFKG